MRFDIRLVLVGAAQTFALALALALTGCSQDKAETPPSSLTPTSSIAEKHIAPNIVAGDVEPADKAALTAWIEEAIALLQSPQFETNFKRASARFPEVYVSETEDIIPSATLLKRLKTQDPRKPHLWWPKTYVVLDGDAATHSDDRLGFGFKGSRKAAAGPHPKEASPQTSGQIDIGRLHLTRYTEGDSVEKSCALNTMVHEISHTLSDKPNIYWMHILDSQRGVTPPRGTFEASYFIGVVAQCTYLENIGRIGSDEFETCLLTFSDPSLASRFRSSACDDFPDGKIISPRGWLLP